MNVIVVILQTSGVTYRNSCKAHVFYRLRHIQRVLDLLTYVKYKLRYVGFGK